MSLVLKLVPSIKQEISHRLLLFLFLFAKVRHPNCASTAEEGRKEGRTRKPLLASRLLRTVRPQIRGVRNFIGPIMAKGKRANGLTQIT